MPAEDSFPKLVLVNLLVAVQSSITYLCLATALSYIFSNTVFIYSFFTGLYLMAMGGGVLIVQRLRIHDPVHTTRAVLTNALAALLLANPGIPLLLFFNETAHVLRRHTGFDPSPLVFPIGILMTVLIGLVSGAELPIFSRLSETSKRGPARLLNLILTSDYFGAALGVLLFAFLLFPFTGLLGALFLSQTGVLVTISVLTRRWPPSHRPSVSPLVLLFFNVYALACLLLRGPILDLLDAMSGW